MSRLGFVPVPKPVCGVKFDDLNGIAHTCVRAAAWTGIHIHRDTQVWFISLPGWYHYWPLKAQRKAALATLTEARRQLEWNDDPHQYDALNTAVANAEKHVLFGRWRGWKYEARNHKIRCPECGKKKADVTTGLDPFAQALDGTSVPMTACNDCFTRRTEEI